MKSSKRYCEDHSCFSLLKILSRIFCSPCSFWLLFWSSERLKLENRLNSWKKCAADSQEQLGRKSQCSQYFHMPSKASWKAMSPDSLKQVPQHVPSFHILLGFFAPDGCAHLIHTNFLRAELGLRSTDLTPAGWRQP